MKTFLIVVFFAALAHGLLSSLTKESSPNLPWSISIIMSIWAALGLYVVVSLATTTAVTAWLER